MIMAITANSHLHMIYDNIGHKHFYVTQAALLACFWWPYIINNIVLFMHTCHICQVQQTQKVLILLIVVTPGSFIQQGLH